MENYKGKTGNKYLDQFFELVVDNKIDLNCGEEPDNDEVLKLMGYDKSSLPTDSDAKVLKYIVEKALCYLYNECQSSKIIDTDITHGTIEVKGKTVVAEGVTIKWFTCHTDEGYTEPFFTYYPEGWISVVLDKDTKSKNKDKEDKFVKKILKENPNITVEEAIRKTFQHFVKD